MMTSKHIMLVSERKVESTFIERIRLEPEYKAMDFIIECSYCRTPDGHAI